MISTVIESFIDWKKMVSCHCTVLFLLMFYSSFYVAECCNKFLRQIVYQLQSAQQSVQADLSG